MVSSQIQTVHSFAELVSTPWAGGVNALCWERELTGDFGAVVSALGDGEGIRTLDEPTLLSLRLDSDGARAREAMLTDLRRLQERELDPVLNCIYGYPQDEAEAVVRTDVFSWHVDSATTEADTWLCTYAGAPSEGLLNDEARRRIDDPETRAALLREYGGAEDADFETSLRECCYDLHYTALPSSRPYSYGVGQLWRIATRWPGCPVPPCGHRAPATVSGEPRLMLIA